MTNTNRKDKRHEYLLQAGAVQIPRTWLNDVHLSFKPPAMESYQGYGVVLTGLHAGKYLTHGWPLTEWSRMEQEQLSDGQEFEYMMPIKNAEVR